MSKLMNVSIENQIQKAWETYHGPICLDGLEYYIPAMPPAFRRGYLDGYEAARAEFAKMESSPVERCEYSPKGIGGAGGAS